MLKQSVSGLFRLKSQEKKKKNDVSLHNVRCVSRNPPPRFVGKNHPTTKQVRHRKRDREILSLAWPAVLGASIDPVLSLLDTYWVSRCLGMVALAALGPALNVEDWMFDILKTVQVPVRSLTSEAVAAKKPGFVPLAPWQEKGEEETSSKVVPRLWGSPGLLTLIVLQATLSGAFRDTTAVLRLVLLGAFLNAVLTPLAVVGMHGGTAGAAWATTVSCYASAVCAWIMVARRPGGPWLPQPRKLFATAFLGKEVEGESKGWGKLLAANAAMTLRSFSSLTTWLVACSIITKIGVAPLAAHTCMTKTFLSFLYWMYGFQLASQVLVSADVAKGLPRRARWTALRAMRMAMLVASATALALWVGRESIAAALVRDLLATWQQVIQSFETLVPPAMAMLLIYGAMWVAEGVLYGLGDYAWAAKCTSFAASAAILVMLLLSRGQTVDHLFDALAGGRSEVRWPDFNDFFRQLEPGSRTSMRGDLGGPRWSKEIWSSGILRPSETA
ncbi:Protein DETOXIFICATION 45 [Durusdinium trenchii]|uniref:Chloroplastic (AtDTX45) (Multidrug and toxic compound extrusion protein 45) (MATE protein 45) n=1 Tax=Durusdinium trenchii TaxID=1381693 RepID=A0ABP0SJC1_9DINO